MSSARENELLQADMTPTTRFSHDFSGSLLGIVRTDPHGRAPQPPSSSYRYSTNEPVLRSVSPPVVLPQFPFGAQLPEPLPTASELLPANFDTIATPSVNVGCSDLPDTPHIMALIEHYTRYTNAAFPIVHIPTLTRLAKRVLSGLDVHSEDASIFLRGCELGRDS